MLHFCSNYMRPSRTLSQLSLHTACTRNYTLPPLPKVFSELPSVDLLLPNPPPIQQCSALTQTIIANGQDNGTAFLGGRKISVEQNISNTMIYVYREDINSPISPAGNKLRKMAYVLPHALKTPRIKTLITVGGVQSNCCRQTASVAARLGLKCIVALTREVDPQHQNTEVYNTTGNVQLEKLLGADVRIFGPSRDGAEDSAELDKQQGKSLMRGLSYEDRDAAFFLSQGASENVGAGVGYAKWVFEMLQQEDILRRHGTLEGSGQFDTIVVACATGGTLAGMVAGMRLAEKTGWIDRGTQRRIIGVETFAKDPEAQRDLVLRIARETATMIGLKRGDIRHEDVTIDGRWTAGGYGIYDTLTKRTINLVARTEALLLDPVYTGKAMTAVTEGIRHGELQGNVLFVHTGGYAVLPAYLGIEGG